MRSEAKTTETGQVADQADQADQVDRRELNAEAVAAYGRPIFDERRRGPLLVEEWLALNRMRFLVGLSGPFAPRYSV